jgi:glutamyl/glutaminyl-tRNA synthetase
MPSGCGRFAPSTTGPAHPGTLLAALLCWLDARGRGMRLLLRLEDLDPDRCWPEHARALVEDLAWLGLDWDEVVTQSALAPGHEAALDRLAALGALYPSPTSRAELEAIGRRAPDGAWAYDNRDRGRALPAGGWRACAEPLRAHLPAGRFAPRDEGGLDLSLDPSAAFGDPVVRRRDGAISYQLAVVVDDAAAGVTRIVRGRDIAPSTALQAALRRLLDLPDPSYRHHFLLLEDRGRKLAKLHGSVPAAALRSRYAARTLCGFLAWCAGLVPKPEPCAPRDLLPDFAWERVRERDLLVRWDGERLSAEEPTA